MQQTSSLAAVIPVSEKTAMINPLHPAICRDAKDELAVLCPMGFTVDQRQSLNRTPVPGLSVCVLGFKRKSGFNGKGKCRLIVKADIHAVVSGADEHFNKVHGLAFDLFKLVETSSIIAADD
jgi:hypothetical protein